MSMHERRFRDHNPEKIPAFVREAVKFVRVDEFLQLRFQRGRSMQDAEYTQLVAGADVIRTMAKEKKKTYRLSDAVAFSANPRVIIARQSVAKISLPEYLAVRHKVLNAVILSTTRRRNEYELLGSREVEKENDKLAGRFADLNLTNKVIAVANIR